MESRSSEVGERREGGEVEHWGGGIRGSSGLPPKWGGSSCFLMLPGEGGEGGRMGGREGGGGRGRIGQEGGKVLGRGTLHWQQRPAYIL